jgi:hypothetical protein
MRGVLIYQKRQALERKFKTLIHRLFVERRETAPRGRRRNLRVQSPLRPWLVYGLHRWRAGIHQRRRGALNRPEREPILEQYFGGGSWSFENLAVAENLPSTTEVVSCNKPKSTGGFWSAKGNQQQIKNLVRSFLN